MSYEIPGFKLGTLKASVDLSAQQYHAVSISGTGTVALCGAGLIAVGVLQNKPISGDSAEIDCSGVTKMVAGAAITPGTESRVMSDSTGRAITAATAGSKVLGIALEAATAAGQIIAVKLLPSVF
jgi:hypothetical protein